MQQSVCLQWKILQIEPPSFSPAGQACPPSLCSCEQGQGCWHRPGVISLTRHCREQTRRDHPALCSISLSQGGIVFHFITSVGRRRLSSGRVWFKVRPTRKSARKTGRTHAEDNHSYGTTQCNHVQQNQSVTLGVPIIGFFCIYFLLRSLTNVANENLSQQRTSVAVFGDEHTINISSTESLDKDSLHLPSISGETFGIWSVKWKIKY